MRSGSLDAGRSSRRKRSPRSKRHKMQMTTANELDASNTNSAVPSTSNSPVLSRKDISVAEMNADAVETSQEALSSLEVEVTDLPIAVSEHISISATESCFKSFADEKDDGKVDGQFELSLNQDEVFQEDDKVESLPVQVSF